MVMASQFYETLPFNNMSTTRKCRMSVNLSGENCHGKSLKRKAESPNLVVQRQNSKIAKIPASKTLQDLVRNEVIPNHIHLKFAETAKINFCKVSNKFQSAEDGNVPLKKNLTCIHDVERSVNGAGFHIREMIDTDHKGVPRVILKSILSEQLNLKYGILFSCNVALRIMNRLENEIKYMKPEEAKIKIFGRFLNIPRKQASFGEPGLKYTFSGATVKAQPWTPVMKELLDIVKAVTQVEFNFVLVNRYKDGRDHIGEHRDDEVDLDHFAPIASLSFGATRDFVLRHKDFRKKKPMCKIQPVTLPLESGSLLVMHPPTNNFWYHSLPVRKKCLLPRVNLTFRKIVTK